MTRKEGGNIYMRHPTAKTKRRPLHRRRHRTSRRRRRHIGGIDTQLSIQHFADPQHGFSFNPSDRNQALRFVQSRLQTALLSDEDRATLQAIRSRLETNIHVSNHDQELLHHVHRNFLDRLLRIETTRRSRP